VAGQPIRVVRDDTHGDDGKRREYRTVEAGAGGIGERVVAR